MRIIAGRDKGRKLKSLDRRDVRPTSDRTKEALFNILGPHVVGTRFLDLYSGFGGIGIEALSRGAQEAIFIEQDKNNIDVINHNLSLVEYKEKSKVITNDVLKGLGILRPDFDLIFMDPPYQEVDLYRNTLQKIKDYNLLHPTGIIIIEHHSKNELDLPTGYTVIKTRTYGNAALTLVREEEENV